MLKRFVLVICVLALAACVEAPESSSTSPTGSDMGTSDLGGDDAEADARAEPDLSGCECAPIIGQVLSSCEDECQYTCAEGFNQCPGEDLVCVPDDVDDPSNGTDDNCDGVVGIVDDAVFVSVDGLADDDNDGLTGLSPVQTLGRAVEVLEAEGRARVILQRGNYPGNLVVDSSVRLEGGWTIDNGIWSPAQGTRSTIFGDDAERPTLTISLDQPSENVTLSNIELEGADAESPGQSVFTLFIRGVQDPEQLVVENVRVVGGTAGDGEDGDDGVPGEDGKTGATGGSESNEQVTPGGEGGAAPSCAAVDFMKGGSGGDSSRIADHGQAGSVGQASEQNGSPGGVGGDGGCNSGISIGDCTFGSRDGSSGAPGRRGDGGTRGSQLNVSSSINLSGEFPVFVPKTLQSGENGKPGSGGGGGGGGGSTSGATAPSGGGGGSGGCGGGGGAAGLQGGASVAILVQDSTVDLSTVEVEMGQAGAGGAGGDGAAGGCGGAGGGVISPSSGGISPGPAGSGGDGGPGGNGAGGDGAPGGPSYGVYVVGSTITEPDTLFESNPAPRGERGEAGESTNCGQAEADDGQDGEDGAVEKIFSRSE